MYAATASEYRSASETSSAAEAGAEASARAAEALLPSVEAEEVAEAEGVMEAEAPVREAAFSSEVALSCSLKPVIRKQRWRVRQLALVEHAECDARHCVRHGGRFVRHGVSHGLFQRRVSQSECG